MSTAHIRQPVVRVVSGGKRQTGLEGGVVPEIEDVLEIGNPAERALAGRSKLDRVVCIHDSGGQKRIPRCREQIRQLCTDFAQSLFTKHCRAYQRLVHERQRVRVRRVLTTKGQLDLADSGLNAQRLLARRDERLLDAEALTRGQRQNDVCGEIRVDVGHDLQLDLLCCEPGVDVSFGGVPIARHRAEEQAVHRHGRVVNIGRSEAGQRPRRAGSAGRGCVWGLERCLDLLEQGGIINIAGRRRARLDGRYGRVKRRRRKRIGGLRHFL